MELPTTLEWTSRADQPGEWLERNDDGSYSVFRMTSGLRSSYRCRFALLRPDPPPEPKPENLRRGELTGEGEGIPCVYVDFADKYGMVPLYRDGEWQECIAERVRPTGKDEA